MSGLPTWTLPSFSTSKILPNSILAPTSPATFSSRIVCPGATRYCLPPDLITAYIATSSSVKTNPDYTQYFCGSCAFLWLFLSLWVGLVVLRPEVFERDVGIFLRCGEARVTE